MAVTELNTSPLNTERQNKALKENEIFLANERKNKLIEERERLKRHLDQENSELLEKYQSIQRQIKNEEGIISSSNEELIGINASLEKAWSAFEVFTDPKANLSSLDEKYPILLMPLRIETRFKKVLNPNGGEVDQLWVRVYPDDCFIDTFEETLSESEISDAELFWMDWWAALGEETKKRAAWRFLVNGHGYGRAQHIIDKFLPVNYDEVLNSGEGIDSPTVYLIINGYPDILEEEKTVLTDYWTAVYEGLNTDNPVAIQEANQKLSDALGEERSAFLVQEYPPKNLSQQPPPSEGDSFGVDIEVKFIDFVRSIDFQKETWSRAPKIFMFPERLYLLGYIGDELVIDRPGKAIPFPLIVGPDPKMAEEDLVDVPGTDVKITRDMQWMVDFDEALAKGMAFKIDLDDDQATSGFDKIFVLGVKMSSTRSEGKEEFETLIKHHYFGNSGFSFLPVGTPTNNTLGSVSGYTDAEDADESYDLVFGTDEAEEDSSGEEIEKFWWERSDREWFCKMLGISESTFNDTINTDGKDQVEARAMHTAMWPATWGYYFDTMLQGTLNDHVLKSLRWYFNNFVVARGIIPSIRIDDQPYGILPTTAFSRMRWLNEKLFIKPSSLEDEMPVRFEWFLPQLNSKFSIVQDDWIRMLDKVSYVGKDGDPHQLLLDILGLHGGSVEFYNRISEGFEHINNLMLIAEQQQAFVSKKMVARKTVSKTATATSTSATAVQQAVMDFSALISKLNGGRELLEELGYSGDEDPDLLKKLFLKAAEKLVGPLIDDQPLSEVNSIRTYSVNPENSEDENYLQWLVRIAEQSFDALRKEDGFTDDKRPNALLYIMLKYALEQSFFHTTLELYRTNELLSQEVLQVAMMEPSFVHIRTASADTDVRGATAPLDSPLGSESRYNLMYQAQPTITGDNSTMVAEYIPKLLQERHIATKYLYDQTRAIRLLAEAPTSRLERVFTEHIDCASYRFDAWKYGVVNYQLEALRDRPEVDDPVPAGVPVPRDKKDIGVNEGLYVGAYGWLENVRSEQKVLEPADIPSDLTDIFNSTEESPILTDSKNLGYINAPSLNHAVTGAILRNGYEAYSSEEDANIFNVNLSSERVRKALKVIEGIQNGQSLAALLGYEFERGIHDNNQENNVDHLVFKIRRKFPLGSNRMNSTFDDSPDVTVSQLEARNVVDGLELIEFAEENMGSDEENPDYIDLLELGDDVSGDDEKIIVAEINNIRDLNDAVADLGFAESIHQVAQGNIDRAAGTLDAYSSGNYPQIPDVVQTPRSGVGLTHRVGLQIEAEVAIDTDHTPRAMAEPGLNKFLGDILPDLSTIRCYVSFYHVASEADITDREVSMSDLNLQPIDLLYLIDTNTDQAMKALDDCVVNHVMVTNWPGEPPRADTEIKIKYYNPTEDANISVFEIISLIGNLKTLLLRSRPLTASDIIGSDEAKQSNDAVQILDKGRLEAIMDYISTQTFAELSNESPKTFLDNYVSALTTSLGESGDDDDTIIANIDNTLEAYYALLNVLSPVGLPQTGTGFINQWKKTQVSALIAKVEDLIQKWNDKEDEYDALLLEYNALTDDAEKIEKLLKMERVISTETTLDPGTDPVAFMNDVISGKLTDFQQKRDNDFQNFIQANHTRISDTLTAISPVLSYELFYVVETDIENIKKACITFANELLNKATLLQKDVNERISKVNSLFDDYSDAADSAKQVKILQDAAKVMLGEDFKMIPSFSVPSINLEEWNIAIQDEDTLLDYQVNTLKNPLPVDDWFYGVARVREKIGSMEKTISLIEGFKDTEIELTPVQFPRLEPYCWFATEFGHSNENTNKALQTAFRENDHLLYTAYYHTPFVTNNQCGLLIDEWTETVPTEDETTGIAFHYDKPNSEPPQTMLLAVSPQMFDKGWSWDDLVAILHETLHEAKLRAVEPELMENDMTTFEDGSTKYTGYGSLLPATISTVTKYPVSIMMNLAVNNLPITANIPIDDE